MAYEIHEYHIYNLEYLVENIYRIDLVIMVTLVRMSQLMVCLVMNIVMRTRVTTCRPCFERHVIVVVCLFDVASNDLDGKCQPRAFNHSKFTSHLAGGCHYYAWHKQLMDLACDGRTPMMDGQAWACKQH